MSPFHSLLCGRLHFSSSSVAPYLPGRSYPKPYDHSTNALAQSHAAPKGSLAPTVTPCANAGEPPPLPPTDATHARNASPAGTAASLPALSDKPAVKVSQSDCRRNTVVTRKTCGVFTTPLQERCTHLATICPPPITIWVAAGSSFAA